MPINFLSEKCRQTDNLAMEELMTTLENIGMPEQCQAICERFDDDFEGLSQYVMYCVALFDDRHEYMA